MNGSYKKNNVKMRYFKKIAGTSPAVIHDRLTYKQKVRLDRNVAQMHIFVVVHFLKFCNAFYCNTNKK